MSKHKFQTEVNQLLDLIIHSLYSHKEIFLRELISNASDALDKLKLLTLTDEKFKTISFDPRIDIFYDLVDGKTITITDSGIGMNETDLEEQLGTIASSGTKNFLKNLSGDKTKDSNLIGQFGVGFYSVFMISDKVEVVSRKAGEEKAFKWTSDGRGEYEITDAERDAAGTTVILYLNDEGKEYADRWKIQGVVRKYSDHIPFPIFFHFEETIYEEGGKKDGKENEKRPKTEQINSASALWKRQKKDLKDEDYNKFYKSISLDGEDPLLTIHTHAEGKLEYTTLFFIPKKAKFDLFRANYKSGVKLYVKRVFITDDDKELLPVYLRFVHGVIDSEDLPLNVSREILQQNRVLASIRSASVKKIIGELEKLLNNDRDKYLTFYREFGVPMKEGLYQDFENKDKIIEIILFKSTKSDELTTLSEYLDRKKTDQKAIYYITGKKEDNLRNSPLLELYKREDIEVLILDDEIDEIVINSIPGYKDIELKSVNRSDAAEELKTAVDKKKEKELKPLVKKIKDALGDVVKDVKASTRLSDSPSCIVADETDPTVQMQNLLKSMGQNEYSDFKPVLEVNPGHEIVKRLSETTDKAVIEDISFLLLEQAMIIEGVELKSPTQFVKRLNRVMEKSL